MKLTNPRETITLAFFFVLGNLANCVYAAFGRSLPSGFLSLYYVGVFWAIAAWIIADARRLGVALPFDVGWLSFFAWPVVLPYHLFKTRGAKGFITLGGLVSLFVVAYLVSLFAFFVIVALRRS